VIDAIAELGRLKKQKDPNIKSNFDIWIEDSYDKKKYPHLILIKFKKEKREDKDDFFLSDWKWVYDGVEYRPHSSELKTKLLYKRGSSRGTDKTPTCKATNNIANTYNLKIRPWFRQSQNASFIDENERKVLEMIDNELEENIKKIESQLSEMTQDLDSGGVVLSIMFYDDSGEKFIGDYELFKKFVIEGSKSNYFSKYKTESLSKNKICAVCKKEKSEVYGFFSSLAFYTVDKAGMVTGGFDQSKSWKNYPVCLDCALDIELGYQFLEEEFKFNFYGLQYYLIPKIINDNDSFEIIDLITEYKNNPKINDSDKITITNAEDEVFDLIKEQKNNITFDMLFFEKPQKSVFRIISLIEDILPSRFHELFEAKFFVDNMIFFQIQKEQEQIFKFNFGVLRTFVPNSNFEGNYDKFFLSLTEKIFNNTKIDYSFMIKQIIHILRSNFLKDQFFWFNSVKSFMLLNYLNQLNLFRLKNKEDSMDSEFYYSFEIKSKEELESKVELFFENFKEFFTSDVHKSIFLIGVLSQFLMNIQQNERGASPFRSKLKGLKMDAKDITSLLPEIIDKLNQYGKNYYVPLENLISKYLISAGDFRNWKLSIDEMNYIFVLGMNLSKYFKIKSEEKNEEE
jgi:CRISPR-associated protein Csh1